MLAIHLEAQQKVVDELREVYGSADAAIDYNSLNKLIYLDMVVKETMRLFPVLPFSLRVATDEFDISKYAQIFDFVDNHWISIFFKMVKLSQREPQ